MMAIQLQTRATVAPAVQHGPATPVSVLLVSPNDSDWVRLSQIFRHTNWSLHRAKGFQEAAKAMRENPVSVLVTDARLPDGRTWQDFVELAPEAGGARVIVTASFKDDPLWAQVINLGGYDVLMKPFDRVEVVRVISLAWLSWRDELKTRAKGQTPRAH